MTGKFIGRPAMGFETGKTYTISTKIEMVRKGGKVFGENMMCICVYDQNSKHWCPYQSLEALLKNWEIISV